MCTLCSFTNWVCFSFYCASLTSRCSQINSILSYVQRTALTSIWLIVACFSFLYFFVCFFVYPLLSLRIKCSRCTAPYIYPHQILSVFLSSDFQCTQMNVSLNSFLFPICNYWNSVITDLCAFYFRINQFLSLLLRRKGNTQKTYTHSSVHTMTNVSQETEKGKVDKFY